MLLGSASLKVAQTKFGEIDPSDAAALLLPRPKLPQVGKDFFPFRQFNLKRVLDQTFDIFKQILISGKNFFLKI